MNGTSLFAFTVLTKLVLNFTSKRIEEAFRKPPNDSPRMDKRNWPQGIYNLYFCKDR